MSLKDPRFLVVPPCFVGVVKEIKLQASRNLDAWVLEVTGGMLSGVAMECLLLANFGNAALADIHQDIASPRQGGIHEIQLCLRSLSIKVAYIEVGKLKRGMEALEAVKFVDQLAPGGAKYVCCVLNIGNGGRHWDLGIGLYPQPRAVVELELWQQHCQKIIDFLLTTQYPPKWAPPEHKSRHTKVLCSACALCSFDGCFFLAALELAAVVAAGNNFISFARTLTYFGRRGTGSSG
jgi:hypothetical protein